ncbi:hypothetical protein [Flavihumibacter sp. CACIAM 22H1]|uniref:hypothetical protein n=1 Tax=Flavihumibacter sp. CACIAM 22H1 TaxID=1812911 RepID=UPI000A652B1D|nr:hypothetical protein [Flavihumibacter sp. CACIAM 22H1]
MLEVLNNVSELRITVGGPDTIAKTLGYYTANDSGDGSYFWDDSSTVTDDGGSVIKASSPFPFSPFPNFPLN